MTKVLIADAATAMRDILELVVEDAGYVPCGASTGCQALAILRHEPQPLVALRDGNLPMLDGLTLLRIVARQRFQQLAASVLTS
jgi:CheY-like chemotaxis protein